MSVRYLAGGAWTQCDLEQRCAGASRISKGASPQRSRSQRQFQYPAAPGGRNAENDEDRGAATPYARHYQNEQEPLIENGGYIIAHAIRISRRAQLICKNLMPDRPTPSRRAL